MKHLSKEEIADIGNYIVGTESKIMEYAPNSIFTNVKHSIEREYEIMRRTRQKCAEYCAAINGENKIIYVTTELIKESGAHKETLDIAHYLEPSKNIHDLFVEFKKVSVLKYDFLFSGYSAIDKFYSDLIVNENSRMLDTYSTSVGVADMVSKDCKKFHEC